MAGRGRGRGGKAAAARAAEEAAAPESTMPPPATSRVTRSAQAQAKEAAAQSSVISRPLEFPRRGIRRADRAQSKASVASITSIRTGRTGTDYIPSQPSQNTQLSAVDNSEDDDIRDRETTIASLVLTPTQQKAKARLMNKFLERLYTSSKDLMEHLLEPEENQDEVWHAELPAFRDSFNHDREHYYVDGSPYFLDLTYVLGSLEAGQGSALELDSARVIAMENITSFLTNIKLTTLGGPDSEVPLTMLQAMNKAIDRILISLRASKISNWARHEANALDLALDLRTQLFIATYRQYGSQQDDPLRLLADSFCHPEAVKRADDDRSLLELLHRGPYSNLMGEDVNLSEDARKNCRMRIDNILDILRYDGNDRYNQLNRRLEAENPYEGFVEQVETWVDDTYVRLDQARHGKAMREPSVELGDGAQSVDQSQVDESQAESDINSQPIIRGPPTSSILLSRDSVLALQQLESGSSAIPPSNQRAAAHGTLNANAWQQAATPGPSNNGALYADSAANSASRKRPLETDDGGPHFDDDDDGAFETDNRAPSSQRRAQAPGRQQSSPKRVRIAPGETEIRPPPRPRAQARPSSSAPPPAPAPLPELPAPPSTQPDLLRLSQMSKQISIASRKAKEPQRRQAWTRDDIHTLIRAVHTYECKWSLIAKLVANKSIYLEHPRDHQALRDKARLVKVDFLKTDSVLPPGFDLVVLGHKERRIIIDVGRNPDRKEADMDEETGLPTNTVYVEPEENPFA